MHTKEFVKPKTMNNQKENKKNNLKPTQMKAKVLLSRYIDSVAPSVHRVYIEPDFKQAESDIELAKEASENSDKYFELHQAELCSFENAEILLKHLQIFKTDKINDSSLYIYFKEGEIKTLTVNQALVSHQKMIDEGWEHASIINASIFIESLFNHVPDEELKRTIQSLVGNKN